MNVFMAAVYTNNYKPGQKLYEDLNEREREIMRNIPHILESYHYVGKQRYVDQMRADGAQVFLDSGAFSAYTLGVSISVEEYCNYIIRNRDIIRHEDGVMMASVLDGIGDPLQTYRNQKEMELRGCKPLPCFHANEDFRYLDYYVNNYEYITLGGMVGASPRVLMRWLDQVFEKYICSGSGRPKCKVHGFGITSIPLMERYPWWSCDSSSWVQSTAFGVIVTPQYGNLQISEKSPSIHDKGQHVSNLSPVERQVVDNLLKEAGFEYERLSKVYQSRAAFNVWAYGEINKKLNENKSDLFDNEIQELL
jgi:hypothetical protein